MTQIHKTAFLFSLLVLSTFYFVAAQPAKQPNFIVILADDLGYGDLGCYGHPTIRTPHLDQMAHEGTRFTQFYVAANVCTPSRAALLTGRLPVRNGIFGKRVVFFTNSANGLPPSEVTIAKALKTKGYQTGLVGKWHLGSQPQYLPLNYGFDSYFGLPYSNDMGKVGSFGNTASAPAPPNSNPPLPLYRDNKIIETEPDQRLLTKRYTDEVLKFISTNKGKPFFMYYASPFPHVPLYASDGFLGKSKRGLYGDVVEELDWSVGQILKKLKDLKLDKNTVVVFLSDNGPWLIKNRLEENGGSAGPLFEAKGSTYEGGMRVPAIFWGPGLVKANTVSSAVATSMDLFPTILNLAKVELPKDRTLDGQNIADLLAGKTDKGTELVYYYDSDRLYAIRKGPWKAHFTTHPSYSPEAPTPHDPALLYNLEVDPGERYEIGSKHPDILEDLKKEFEKHRAGVVPVPPLLDAIVEK
ncbi:sulfatase family protein [Larkinella terrae]|uniref:Sulfatase-like hydrolase/transferase n=1 Tax=Larkinella terrae TaxID=2025311 RepID=A0A7K0ELT0_9BACT|nr:sulfatase [Larkinella terrae]MRS62797.1 sulfatase-like hydrolase/transferase [Larkinella terrae]